MSEKPQTELIKNIELELDSFSQTEKIALYTKFFRAIPGDICEGDVLLAIKVPDTRRLAKHYYTKLDLADLQVFLENKIHEYRLFALICLIYKYQKAQEIEQFEIYNFYLKNTKHINHWDLVDNSSAHILGHWTFGHDRSKLLELANSPLIWERRMAVVANLYYIKYDILDEALEICAKLITDKHEYIQKACGWILREIGKKDEKVLIDFLKANWQNVSSITKSYATEKLRLTYDTKALFR